MLKIFRPINLCISACSLLLMQFAFVNPLLHKFDIPLQFSVGQFFILLLASVLVQASGYVINDYFDVNIDQVNKPEQVIVGKSISQKSAMRLYIGLSIAALFFGIWVSFSVHKFNYILLFVLPMGLLWFYSQSYKRMFVVGNVVVAFCTALFAALVGIFNFSVYPNALIQEKAFVFYAIFIFTSISAVYAFFTTIVREIIKDCEDIEGDNDYACDTIPIRLGIEKTKIIVIVLNIALILFSSFLIYTSLQYSLNIFIVWLIVFILILCFQIFLTLKSNDTSDFKLLSDISKIAMVWGILLPIFAYVII